MDNSKNSPMAEGLYTGIKQRAIWFDLLLKAAQTQGCDIEKLTDDAIFQYGTWLSAGCAGEEPRDLMTHMHGSDPFFELFEKEVICDTPDYCELRHHRCPLVDAWREFGLDSARINDLCNLANKGDFGRASNFHDTELEIPSRIGGGDAYCTMAFKRKK